MAPIGTPPKVEFGTPVPVALGGIGVVHLVLRDPTDTTAAAAAEVPRNFRLDTRNCDFLLSSIVRYNIS
jgi:hypothetical protein